MVPCGLLVQAQRRAGGVGASVHACAGGEPSSAADRARALGMHGVFGSLGIGFAPFAAALILDSGMSWRAVYGWLSVPGVFLGVTFVWISWRHRTSADVNVAPSDSDTVVPRWRSFFTLTVFAMLQGFIYAAVFSFLPRYLSEVPDWVPQVESLNQTLQHKID